MSDRITANNPQIGVITHVEKQILDSFSKGHFLIALRQMYSLNNLVRGVHRNKELADKIQKEYNHMMGVPEAKRAKYTQKKAFTYIKWLGELMDGLYDNGYLSDAGYGFYDPSEGRKSE